MLFTLENKKYVDIGKRFLREIGVTLNEGKGIEEFETFIVVLDTLKLPIYEPSDSVELLIMCIYLTGMMVSDTEVYKMSLDLINAKKKMSTEELIKISNDTNETIH